MTRLTVSLPIETSQEEKGVLLKTMESFNKACGVAAQEDKASRFELHRKVYRKLRTSGLSSRFAIRAIAKVADAMKATPHPRFYFHGAIPYDQRNSELKPAGTVSLYP